MDPVSFCTVLNALKTSVTFVLEKIDKLDRISKEETLAVEQYRKALLEFSKDAENVTAKLDAIVYHGNKVAVSVFLGTQDGQLLFQRLLSALNSADDLLNKQGRAADALFLEVEKFNRCDPLSLLSNVDKDYERFNSILGAATATLDDSRTDVIRLFEQFHGLYEIHRQARHNPSLAVTSSPNHRGECRRSSGHSPLHSIQLSFYDQPFYIAVDRSYALEISENLGPITSDKDRLDCYAWTLKDMAERWVDDHLGEVTVAELWRTHIDMIRNLQKTLDLEVAAFKSAAPEIPNTETLRYAHLVDITYGIKKEIARENGKRFSIAFCGMVKAGCV
jgi:hypothetical protein